jgi:NAD(P)H dehydrogenase (quinone)
VRTLVVHCHPDPDSFVAAVHDAALRGLRGAGHEIRVTDLHASSFQPARTETEHSAPGVSLELQPYADDLQWCESLVLVYPTWWAAQPAMLKGWMDRVWVEGVAFERSKGANRRRGRLRNIRRITMVTTHGSSKFVNALEGEAGKRTATRALRAMCSRRCRTRWIALYTVDRSTAAQRQAFLERVTRRLGR